MKEDAFREYLVSKGMKNREINSQISFIKNLESQIQKQLPSWTFEDLNHASVQAVVNDLIDQGENSIENLQAMVRYAKVIDNEAMFVTIFQMLDGYEAMEQLYDKMGSFVGEDLRDIIFEGMPLPPLGLSQKEKAQYTYRILNRMETIFEQATCREILKDCLRILPDAYYSEDKTDFYDICKGDIDRFLDLKREKFLNTLNAYKSRNELFFGQKITDEVIDFVNANPQIGGGTREGNIIFETKIPYNTEAYLAETDPDKKRYHYCHCPWARESLKKRTFAVPSFFCQCSAGFHKKRYEVIFNQPIRAEVQKCILGGDSICQFAIHLPEDWQSNYQESKGTNRSK